MRALSKTTKHLQETEEDLMAAASEQRRTKNLVKEDHFAEAGLLDIFR